VLGRAVLACGALERGEAVQCGVRVGDLVAVEVQDRQDGSVVGA
jgi:hypothetical protein